MAIIPTWQSFRWTFSAHVDVSLAAANIAAGPPSTVTRIFPALGNFVTNGFEAGQSLDITGTALNNGRYTIATVAALVLTLSAADACSAEPGCAPTLVGVHRDPDGVEEWPGGLAGELGHTELVRAAGFDTGLLAGFSGTYGDTMVVSANTLAADAVKGTDEYDWYLSQRSDDVAKQYLYTVQMPTTATNSYSGTIYIAYTALAQTELDFTTPPLSTSVVQALYRHVHVYCRRRSDGAIQWLDLQNEIANT